MHWILLGLLTVAVVCDLRKMEIPNWISVAILACALAAAVLEIGEAGWLARLVGLALAVGISIGLFAIGAWGGGDAKILVALGAALGWPDLLQALFYMALAGGVLALVAGLRGKEELAYGPAFGLGMLGFVLAQEGGLNA